MSTEPDVAVSSPRAASSGLRAAGISALVAAALTLLQPAIVFLVPWTQLDPGFSDLTHKLDPVATMSYGWLGFLQGLHFLGIAAALVVAAARLARGLGGDLLAGIAHAAGAVGAALTVVIGGIAVTGYTTGQFSDLARVQADAAVRKMIGFAEIGIMQGLAGAAGIAIALWVAAGCGALHAAHRTGRALPVASIAIAAVIVVPWLLGYGAATSLLAFVPLTVAGIALLRIGAHRQ